VGRRHLHDQERRSRLGRRVCERDPGQVAQHADALTEVSDLAAGDVRRAAQDAGFPQGGVNEGGVDVADRAGDGDRHSTSPSRPAGTVTPSSVGAGISGFNPTGAGRPASAAGRWVVAPDLAVGPYWLGLFTSCRRAAVDVADQEQPAASSAISSGEVALFGALSSSLGSHACVVGGDVVGGLVRGGDVRGGALCGGRVAAVVGVVVGVVGFVAVGVVPPGSR
jgi:hypothetical protein